MIGSHPALILVGVAILVGITRGKLQQYLLVGGTFLSLVSVVRLVPGVNWTYDFSSYRLELLNVDSLSQLFGLIFCLITLIGSVYALHTHRRGEHAATLVYAAGALGVVFAGDWITVFVFWELMGMASVFVVWYGGTKWAGAAGFRYLLVHIFGGSLLFAGIVMYLTGGGSLHLDALRTTPGVDSPLAYGLILSGIAINAAIPPLHSWLTDAYPEASVTGTVFLSAFTTKTAVYMLLRVFPGTEILVWVGVIMAVYGVVFAVLENDIRRLLAYHIISQVGYMVAGVGVGTPLALSGVAAHAFCHILYKALLLMGAGAVIQATGKQKLTELGGLVVSMPLVLAFYAVGAVSISGFPLFNGFISKSMIISAAAESGRPGVEILLVLASIGTFLHTGLKLPYFTFFGPNRCFKPVPTKRNMLFAMGVTAALCFCLGSFPGWLYSRLALQPVTYSPYTLDHVVSSLQLLVGTGVGFWFLLRKVGGEPTVSLDTDWVYRKPLRRVFDRAAVGSQLIGYSLQTFGLCVIEWVGLSFQGALLGLSRLITVAKRQDEPVVQTRNSLDLESPLDAGRFYRQPVGLTIFWVVAFLVALTMMI